MYAWNRLFIKGKHPFGVRIISCFVVTSARFICCSHIVLCSCTGCLLLCNDITSCAAQNNIDLLPHTFCMRYFLWASSVGMLNWVFCSGSQKVAVLAGTKVPSQGSTGEGSPPAQVAVDSILFFAGYWNWLPPFLAGYWPSVASWLLPRNCPHFFSHWVSPTWRLALSKPSRELVSKQDGLQSYGMLSQN